jgi:TRAP-type C4-dicarboxylate transport system substrate-binding protein
MPDLLATPQNSMDIWYETGLLDLFNERLKDKGLFIAGWYSPGSVDIVVHTKKHILVPDDLKGKKMRMWGGTWAEVFKELGTGLVTMPSAEVYIALQRGTVEGAGSALSAAYGFKWQEVAPYWSYFAKGGLGGPYHVPYMFSLDKWNTLPKDLQEKVKSAARKSVPVGIEMREKWDAGLVDKATAEGAKIQVPDPAPWIAQLGPMAKRIYLERGGDLAQEVWSKVEAWHQKTGR